MKHVYGRILITVDMEYKNKHKFDDGTVIELRRNYDQFNNRIKQPVNGTVVSADNVPVGSEILIGHNSLDESNKIYSNVLSGDEIASDIQYYSIPEVEAYLYREKSTDEWKCLKGFATGLRVYKPYTGTLEGIKPTLIKDVMYVTSDCDLKGKIVHTLKSCDYSIIYQETNGRESEIIRFRYFGNETNEREEVVGVSDLLTDKLKKGELLVGYSENDCKII